MKLVIEIDRIKLLASQKEADNWGFRSFLKSCDIPSTRIDSIAHRIYNQVAAQIDCKTCGNCCKEMTPVLKAPDITRLAGELNLTEDEVKEKYLAPCEEKKGSYTFNVKPCPFLEGTVCSVYNARPADCQSYPHLHKKGISARTICIVQNCSVCPIVFNVYEALKSEIWSMADEDFDDENFL